MTILLRLALSAMLIKNAVIKPKGMLTASAVKRCTRISGIGESTSSSAPNVSSAMPPAVSTPWLANFGFGGKKHESSQNQHQRGETRGQQIQGEGSDQNEDHAHQFRELPLQDD